MKMWMKMWHCDWWISGVDKWKRGEVVGDSVVEEDFVSDKRKFVENTV